MQNKNNLAYFILILTTIFWSGNFIVGKAASTYDIPPFSLNFYRWFFAGLILFPFTIKELIAKKEYILENIGFFEYVKSRRTCLIEWGETIEELIDSEYNKFTLVEKNNLRVLKKNR